MSSTKKQSMYDIYFKITEECYDKYGFQTILFYQVGAFFEIYGLQDNITRIIKKSKIEEFTQLAQLTMSEKDFETPNGTIIMAGFRDYTLDKYIKIATANGFTAVVYNQNATNPKAITREFYGVYSPGTFISYELDSSQPLSNNLVCIWLYTYVPINTNTPQLVCGISSAHIFTGESTLYEYETPYIINSTTFDELERSISLLLPSETILISYLSDKDTQTVVNFSGLAECNSTIHVINMNSESNKNKRDIIEKCSDQKYMNHQLTTVFGYESYNICQEFSQYPTSTQSFIYLLHFIQERNPDLLKKMTLPRFLNSFHRVRLANHTLQQLNIIENGAVKGKISSVSSFLNHCCTPMGTRAFKRQITNPSSNIEWLNTEYKMMDSFMNLSHTFMDGLRKEMKTIHDLEKMCRQIVVQKMYPNTIFQLYNSMLVLHKWHDYFTHHEQKTWNENLNHYLGKTHPIDEFIHFLDSVLYIDRCKNIESLQNFQENFFRPGHFENLDTITNKYEEYQTLLTNIYNKFNEMMRTKPNDTTEYIKIHDTDKSGISLQMTPKRALTLKQCLAQYNEPNTPGHITIGQLSIPIKEIRFVKSSSGKSEDIHFPQLNTLLQDLRTIKETWSSEIAITFHTFLRTLEINWYDRLEEWIQWSIRLDLLQNKTYVAQKYGYCKPEIQPNDRSFIEARGIRHVLIEHIQQNETYVTNDVFLSSPNSEYDGMLIFGINAVGKTSLIRSIGICVILAQAGMYVPCNSFVFSPYTAIFSRILGNDNLFKGLSTFAVEMSELRVILKSANHTSLVLGDELCSGTEMESALSLFSSGLIHLSKKEATYLFATHFHEITSYSEINEIQRLGMKHMSVHYDPSSKSLVYDRILKDGQGSRTYGLEVCRSLYMDPDFLETAYTLRNKYFPQNTSDLTAEPSVYNSKKIRGKCEICHKDMASETHHLSPQRNADPNGFIQEDSGRFHKNHPGNLASVCEECHKKTHSTKKRIVRKKTTTGYILCEQNK